MSRVYYRIKRLAKYEDLYAIKIKGKKVYLSEQNNKYIWSYSLDESTVIYYDKEKCKKFAKAYFKSFKEYEIAKI